MEQRDPILRTEEDLEAVLRLAVRHDSTVSADDLRSRLEATASELGLSRESLDAAEAEYRNELAERATLEEAALAWKKFRLDRARNFLSHLATYLAVNAGLVSIDWIKDGRVSWALYVLAGWGIAIASDAVSTFFPNTEARERFERRRKRRAASQQQDYGESSSSSEPSSTR